jgi:hypothetical protein
MSDQREAAYRQLSDLLSETHRALLPKGDVYSDGYWAQRGIADGLHFRLWKVICDYRDACVAEGWKR